METKIIYAGNDWVRPWGNLRYQHGTKETPNPLSFKVLNETIQMETRRGEIYDYEIRIQPGTYYMGHSILTPTHGARVRYVADGGEVILSGGRAITGFRETEVNGVRALVAEIPLVKMGEWSFEELYVNKEPRRRPVFPKGGEKLRVAAVPAYTAEDSSRVGYFEAEPGVFDTLSNVEDMTVEVLHYWLSERFPVVSYDKETRLVRFSAVSCRPFDDDRAGGFAKYRIINVFEAMNEPGEWYLNKKEGKLYYIPMEGETADNILVEAPVETHLLSLVGTPERPITGISFSGITFENLKSDPNHVPGQKNPASYGQAAANRGGAVELSYASQIHFEGCHFRNCGNYALALGKGATYNTVVDSEFSGCGAGGIRIHGASAMESERDGTGFNRIEGCHIHHCTLVDYGAIGIWVGHARSNRIAHNEIHHLKYSGISVGWVWGMLPSRSDNNIIEYNHIYACGDGDMSDMGGIYLLGPQGGTEVRGNYIHDIHRANYGGWGIYLDEGSTNVLVEKNVVYDCDSQAFFTHYGRENIVRHNIFGGGDAVVGFGAGIEANFDNFQKNLFYIEDCPVYFGDYNYDFSRRWLVSDANFLFHGDAPLTNLRYAGATESWDAWVSYGCDTLSLHFPLLDARPMKTPDALLPYGFPADVAADKAGRQH